MDSKKTTTENDLNIYISVRQGCYDLRVTLDEAANKGEVLDCVDNLLDALFYKEA